MKLFTMVLKEITMLMMRKINAEMDGKLDMALKIFENKYPKRFLHTLVSGQLLNAYAVATTPADKIPHWDFGGFTVN